MRGTSLIEIRVFSDDPSEAAMLANAIARTYQEHNSGTNPAEIMDLGVPGLRPVWPNRPRNIALGLLGGMFLALLVAAAMAGIVVWIGRKRCRTGVPPGGGAPCLLQTCPM